MKFPFLEPDEPNTAAILCCHALEQGAAIQYASHDAEDGAWQFLCEKEHEESDARVVSLDCVYSLDPTIAEIAAMPRGYYAERKDRQSAWEVKEAGQKEEGKNAGQFTGFVLLSDASWDKERLICDLKEKWNIDAVEEEGEENTLVFSVGNMTAAFCLMPAPIPNGEAEINAENNYMWRDAVQVAKAHKAHILIAVLGNEADFLQRGMLYTKLVSCCCRQTNATGVYTSGVVFEPQFYEDFAEMMREDMLPIYNWIWFGLYRSQNGVCCYTYGMHAFGKDEMEVLDADAEPADLREFLSDLAGYVLEYDATLCDGETIGFSEEDKHAITRSEGVSLPGITLKIAF